jgi:hypothetical protein
MKVFSGVLRGGDCIGDARSAWRGCWRFGLQRSRTGRHKVPMLTLQMVPRDDKIYPSAWEEMQPYLDIFLRALACWSVILGQGLISPN